MRVPGHQRKSYAWRWTAALAGLAVLSFALVMALVVTPARVRAAQTVTIHANKTISADAASVYQPLNGPAIQEGGPGEIHGLVGDTIQLNAPVGFEFDSAGNVHVAATNGLTIDDNSGCTSPSSTALASVTASRITVYFCAPSTSASTITWSGIKVRPTAAHPLASGDITETGSAVWTGGPPVSFGVLTEVNGAPASIVLTPPGVPSGLVLAILGAWSAHVEDQFGNDAIGATVNWTINTAPTLASCQQLIAPQATTNGTGDATTSLKLGNEPGIYGLSVTSGGAGPATSVATATGPSGAGCTLPTPTSTNTPLVTDTPTSTATPVPGAATLTPTPGAATPGAMESVALVAGCNPVASSYADATAIATIAGAVSPSSILVSIWKFDPATSSWLGYAPGVPADVNNLTSVDRLDAIFICVSAAGTWSRPII